MFWCIYHPLKITLLATKNASSPTEDDLGGWNKDHFIGNLIAKTESFIVFCVFDLFTVNTSNTNKKDTKNVILQKEIDWLLKFLFFRNSNNWEWYALLLVLVNEIKSSILFYLWNCRRRRLSCRTWSSRGTALCRVGIYRLWRHCLYLVVVDCN